MKGWKDDRSKNETVKLETSADSTHIIACPIKWLIILALRTGAVAQHSIEELERAAETKPVTWSAPGRPVLCAFKQQGSMLIMEQPATNAQLLKTLRSACDLAGMLQVPVTHDVRRGAAADVAHLPSSLRGASTTDSARVLGHQSSSRESGLTARYIGGIREDTWKKRLASDFEDDFGPTFAEAPFKRARQSTTKVKEICEELGLDSDQPKERDRARGIGRTRLRERWMENALEPTLGKKKESDDTRPNLELETTISLRSREENTAQEEIPIDPRLLKLSQIMTTGIDNLDEALSMLDELAEDAGNNVSQTHFPPDLHGFVSKFAKINVYRNEVVGDTMPLGAVSGGSRDPPSRWLYHCNNAPACKKTFVSYHLQQSHAAHCNPSAKIVHPFACSLCESTFPTQNGLNVHSDNVHGTWTSRTCGEEGCTSNEVFKTRGAYISHRQNFHSDWSPRECPECPELPEFGKRNAFVAHMKKKHPDRLEDLMPGKTKKRKRASLPETLEWMTSKCMVPGCKSNNTYDTRAKYLQHLRVMHKIKAAHSAAFMPKK